MVLKALKISLVLILAISFFGFVVDKNVTVKTDNAKMKLVKDLTTKKASQVWKSTPRRSAAIDVSKVRKSKEKLNSVKNFKAAVPISDLYGDDVAAVESFSSMAGLTAGTSIGTSSFYYGTAYYGRNIAIGNDGSIHAIWSTSGDPSNVVMYSRSNDGGETWTTPIVVNDGYYGYKPAIAVDFNNPMNVHVAYVGYMNQGETRTVRYVKSEDGGDTWLPSVLIAGSNVNTNNPDIAIDQDGNPHVAFDSYSDTFIRYNFSTDGGTTWLEEPEIVNTGFGEETFSAAIAIDNDGNPHVLFGGGGAAGSWGDKGTYWNWRDMATGTWQEVPPVELAPAGAGTPYPSMVFDSQGIGHCWYDNAGSASGRGIWYQTYDPASGWSAPTEIFSEIPGGSTIMPQCGIDPNDNLFLGYIDDFESTGIEPPEGDFFTGTNIFGDWQYVNVSSNGPAIHERHPNVARHILAADSVMHCLYAVGDGPVDIVYDVGFPWPPNPKCAVNDLPNTFNLTGPFHITAVTSDLDGTVESCSLYVWLNGEEVAAMDMASTAPDVWEAEFTVNGAPGDQVSYQAVATDNDGLKGQSFLTLFDILEPANPGADLLLVGDDMRILDMFTSVLDELGYVYEYWDIDANGGIDASVTDWGWTNIIVAGWGVTSVPTRDYTGNPYADFLNNGGDLTLISQDYFYANGEDPEPVFEAGDFAYDFFQLDGGVNDPAVERQDSVLLGSEDDPISANWFETPLELHIGISGIANWMDYTAATGSGFDCFFAFNQGDGAGVWNDAGTYRTVFLPFMFEWLGELDPEGNLTPNEDAINLMQNILDFMNVLSPPVITASDGPRYGVYGYGPFDVTAEAADYALAKGMSVVSMEVGYMIDDDVDYTWVPMTSVGNGKYEGQIPELTAEDTVIVYKFKVTDDDGLIGMSKTPSIFWTTGLEATPDVKLLYCGDDPYDWYYTAQGWPNPVDLDVTNTLDQVAADNNFAYDYWDVDTYGPPDYQTVLANYDAVIWHGYADWIPDVFPIMTEDNTFYPFVMNGGNLLFSSEEMLGTLYDWPSSYSPAPGEAVFDVLNVSWIGSDFNYDTSRVMSTMDPVTEGMDSILALVGLPFGFMGDLADPVNLDAYILDAWLPAYGAWYGDWGYGVGWYYEDPATTSKRITMAYCLANLDEANRYAFLTNVCKYFGIITDVDRKVGSDIPNTFALHNNYPNPFNPETAIAYDLPKDSHVQLAVYNVIGQKIRTLVNGNKVAGRYQAVWDGRDDFGQQVASGVYFYKIMAGDFVQSHKMMLVK